MSAPSYIVVKRQMKFWHSQQIHKHTYFLSTLNKYNVIILQITNGWKLCLSLIVPLASYAMLFWEKDGTLHVMPESWQQLLKRKVSSYTVLASVHFVITIISQKSIAIKMTSAGTTITIISTKYCPTAILTVHIHCRRVGGKSWGLADSIKGQ